MIIAKKVSHYSAFILIIFVFSCNGINKNESLKNDSETNSEKKDSVKHYFVGEKLEKEELNGFLKDSNNNLLKGEILIKDTQTLISIAEPILFNIYGKQSIIDERPYEVNLFGDYWIMSGTLKEGWIGGTFSFAINRKTCTVVGISHGK